jgi:flagellin
MALVINTNVASLNAQRQLMNSGNALDQATERLSSGQRINSAKDDAAGLAISNRMTSQVRGLDQAIRNANDGISMIQTAEGALQETTNILQRMRELSVQSANGIYTDGDRETLNSEVEQLREEMNRIASETSFNGQKLLDGSLGQVDLQVGDQSRQIISLEVPTMDAKNLGGTAGGDIVGVAMEGLNFTSDTAPFTDNIEINGQTVRASDLNDAGSLNEFLDVINSSVSNVRATAVTETVGDSGSNVTGVLSGADEVMKFDLVNADGVTSSFQVSNTGSMEALVNKINQSADGKIEASLSDEGGLVLASEDGTSIDVSYVQSDGTTPATNAAALATATGVAVDTYGPRLALTSTDNSGITINYADTTGADAGILGIDSRFSAGTVQGTAIDNGDVADLAAGALVINGVEIGAVTSTATDGAATATSIANAINDKSAETGVSATATAGVLELKSVDGEEISIKYGDVASNAATLANTGLRETNTVESFGESIANIDISTQEGAQNAIDTIDRALVEINDVRAELGAANNRLDFTISNLSNVSEKTSAARSRIMDADFAAETAKLSQAQVLQQASQAMLAQANARPQQVLQLLQ